jgi:hypothetical protein
MLQIRADQLKALSLAQESRANRVLVSYVMERFPAEFQERNDPSVLEFVQGVRSAARQFGIEREDNIATFLDMTVMYGQDFPTAPWARDILVSEALHGPDKVALLRHRIEQTGVTL